MLFHEFSFVDHGLSGSFMSTAGAGSAELDVAEAGTSGAAEPPISLSPVQRKALADLCRFHERGISPKRFSWRTLLLALYVAFALGFCVLLQFMTAFAGPAYLLLGFILGTLLKDLRILMIFRRIWPVYDAIIDWPRAFQFLREIGKSRGGDTDQNAA